MNELAKKEPSMKGETQNDGWIRKISPQMTTPSLKDNTADVDRLTKGIKKALDGQEVAIDFSLAKKIPSLLRKYGYEVQAVLYEGTNSWHLVDLFPLQNENPIYGLAVDLGSSTVVLRLLDLNTREIKDETSFLNPQVEIGQDILTRINFASKEGGLQRLQAILVDRLNEEISRVAKRHGIRTASLLGMCVAGNRNLRFWLSPMRAAILEGT